MPEGQDLGGLDLGRVEPWAVLDPGTTWTPGRQEPGLDRTLGRQEPAPGWTLDQAGPGIGRILEQAEHRARLDSKQSGP